MCRQGFWGPRLHSLFHNLITPSPCIVDVSWCLLSQDLLSFTLPSKCLFTYKIHFFWRTPQPLFTFLADSPVSFPILLPIVEPLTWEHISFVTKKSEYVGSKSGFTFHSGLYVCLQASGSSCSRCAEHQPPQVVQSTDKDTVCENTL